MTTYRASVHVDEGMLHTSRPLTAPEAVGSMFDSVVYDMAQADGPHTAGVLSIELVIEVAGESDTPIGDTIAGTSSTPLPPDPDLDGPDPDAPALETAPAAVPGRAS